MKFYVNTQHGFQFPQCKALLPNPNSITCTTRMVKLLTLLMLQKNVP